MSSYTIADLAADLAALETLGLVALALDDTPDHGYAVPLPPWEWRPTLEGRLPHACAFAGKCSPGPSGECCAAVFLDTDDEHGYPVLP